MYDGSPPIPRVALKLRLGELTLGQLERRLVVHVGFGAAQSLPSIDEGLRSLPGTAHGVLFRSIPAPVLSKLRFHRGGIRYVPRQYDRYFADLSTPYQAYLSTFSGKSRSTLRRKVRRFEERSGGSIQWRSYRTREECEEFYRRAREISAQSYQERLLDAGLPVGAAFRAAMLEAAGEGRARGYLIFHGNEAIAYLYCPIQDGVVSYAYLGYRPEFADLSPGTVLLWLVMEDLFRDGSHRIFDFTEGGDRSQHSQKRLFATQSVRCADVYDFKWTAANLGVVLTHATTEWVGSAIGVIFERLALKKTVRSWIRRAIGA